MKQDHSRSRERPPPRPIEAARLEEMALSYVARFATSAAKLEDYLRRKLRERGWAGEGAPPVAEVVGRMVSAGYVDDEVYARARTGSLLRRGYGARRISQALGAAGIDDEVRSAVRAPQADQRRAALAFARKRRIGPYGPPGADRALREKQLSAMLRAGHPLDSARELLNAASVESAEEWAAAGDE